MKRPSAILCSDLHLRDSQPLCRTDDYWSAQSEKIKFIRELQEKYKCPVLCGGDVFHKAKSSQYLEAWAIQHLPKDFISVCGQHDLPNHNIKNINHSSFGVMIAADKISGYSSDYSEKIYIKKFPYGTNIVSDSEYSALKDIFKIALIHTFIQKPNDEQDRIIGGYSANAIMNKLKDFDLIVSGDNHKTFTVQMESKTRRQILVNPGSMMRTRADQLGYKPCVYLWYADAEHMLDAIEPVYFPIIEGVISREHIEIQETKDDRIQSFVERLNDGYEIGLNFQQNIENYFNKNKTRKPVQEIVWESFDGQ